MVTKNAKSDLLGEKKVFAKLDTSYSSFWLYNRERDMLSEHFRDKFVNFYDEKELLSEFNPNIAKNIISFWSEDNDIILDPFAGRTRALVAYAMNRQYVGYEISSDVVNYMYKRFVELKLFDRPNFMVDIRNEDCFDIDKSFNENFFDLVFTCPPYWNLEKYQSAIGQLSDIKDYDMFMKSLVMRLLKAVKYLKKDKFMCIVLGDFRKDGKYYTLHSDLLELMKRNKDVVLHDVIAIQNIPFHTAAFYFGAIKHKKATAKAHEYLLIWKKVI
jgi:DNA modification methylase